MPLLQFTHWFNLLSSRIARCRSVVRTGSIFWVVNHCISDYSSKIGYTTVSSSLYNVTSVHLNIWSCSLGLAVHLAHSIFSHVLLVIIHKPDKQVSTLKAYAIMRLSSFAYRITTQDWESLSALHSSHFYYLNFAVYV